MPSKTTCRSLVCALLLLVCVHCDAQRMFLNTTSNVYEIIGTPGHYTFNNLGHFCLEDTSNILSTAMHGDTMYLITPASDLYRVLLSVPGSCQYLGSLADPPLFTFFEGLACDKNGILYAVSDVDLYRYDPHTNEKTYLGILPVNPDGDLVFYNDMLLCAAGGAAIYSINIEQPSASVKFMDTQGYQFWGMAAMPGDCVRNRLFGLTGGSNAQMVEIDPVAKTILGVVIDSIPLNEYDACSTLEDGAIAGVLFDSLAVVSACGDNSTGSLQVFSSSASAGGTTTYTLDGALTNTTGLFPAVTPGSHSILIQAAPGCTVDSVFTLKQGLSNISFVADNPEDCAHPDGSIQVLAASQSAPILYSINGNAPQASPVFSPLTAASYSFVITDAGHCETDTSIALSFQHILPLPGTITTTPALCAQKNGSIAVTLNGSTDPATITAALNTGAFQFSLSFAGLDAGIDTLHVYSTDGCRFDSVLVVPKTLDQEPSIQAVVRDQLCFTDNGSISLSVMGADGPYLGSLDHGAYGSGLRFDGLSPIAHTISIQDKNTCSWDTSFTVLPYPKDPVTLSVDTVNPVCTSLNSGSLTIKVQGDQAPYWLSYNNTTYASGSTIYQLNNGNFSLPVINQDGCVVDTVHTQLGLDIKPECELIYLPNAFTPNGNGVNDLFRVMHSPYLTTISLRVYNRYGGLLFVSSGQTPGWDGTFHGELQPAGTYVWEVDYADLEKVPKTTHGIVLLIR